MFMVPGYGLIACLCVGVHAPAPKVQEVLYHREGKDGPVLADVSCGTAASLA